VTRKLRPEETKLWGRVVSTVRPAASRLSMADILGDLPPGAGQKHDPRAGPMILTAAAMKPAPKPSAIPPDDIEPGRKRRIVRGRDELEARLDLHGLDQQRARVVLDTFLRRAHADNYRHALIITGKGVTGDGILRRRAPEWLSDPDLRGIVAGFSTAAQHHGGDGAFYVALKRKRLV
jgi:DNA-nicking Smr family endonuclease